MSDEWVEWVSEMPAIIGAERDGMQWYAHHYAWTEAERANCDVDYEQLRADRDRLAGGVERLMKLAYDWKRKAEYLGKDRELLVRMNESLSDALDAARSAGGEG